MKVLNRIPYLLIIFRLVAGLTVLLLVLTGLDLAFVLISLIFAGLTSDVFDGFIARKLDIVSEFLRKSDSYADLAFYILIGVSLCIRTPAILYPLILFMTVHAALEFGIHLVSLVRFKKQAATHHYLAKFFQVVLFGLIVYLVFTGEINQFFWITFCLSVVSQFEGIAIMLVIPEWQADISSLRTALKMRSQLSL